MSFISFSFLTLSQIRKQCENIKMKNSAATRKNVLSLGVVTVNVNYDENELKSIVKSIFFYLLLFENAPSLSRMN